MSPFKCIETGDTVALERVVRATGIDVKAPSGMGLLHVAAGRRGSPATVEFLISRGIDVNLQDEDGVTPLIIAVVWKRADAVMAILAAGGRLDVVDKHGNEPLWYAVNDPRRDYSIIELLLKHGANPHHKNRYGRSPFNIAEAWGIEKLRQVLDAS